ncbi:MAG: ADP-ribosylglycohydrolase family protein [Methanomicrobiales archaeon]|nr:ADP-ribosylglycohydrolase family protein [Methanomicrobiales archaeon]
MNTLKSTDIMLGAIIGDIVGSRFEWNNIKTKDFEFFSYACKTTDDSIMSLAIAQAFLTCRRNYSTLRKEAIQSMQQMGRSYPGYGYGGLFEQWICSSNPEPYNSFGNGAAMRVSACGFIASTLEESKLLARMVTDITHNHPEGIKGGEATAVCVFLARTGKNIDEIRDYVHKNYYPMNFTLDSIRERYEYSVTCQNTVPQAIMAFLESTDFEDAIRNAISIGGDSDTLAAITGAIAEAYYGIPLEMRRQAVLFLDEQLLKILIEFENEYPPKAYGACAQPNI